MEIYQLTQEPPPVLISPAMVMLARKTRAQTLSCTLSEARRNDLIVCIQLAQTNRGFAALSGNALEAEVFAWNNAMKGVPDDFIVATFDWQSDRHDWNEPFRVGNLAKSFHEMAQHMRGEQSGDKLNPTAAHPNVCSQCRGLGWQYVWRLEQGQKWNRGVRPCHCLHAPALGRNNLTPIVVHAEPGFSTDGLWCRNRTDEFCRVSDLLAAPCLPDNSFKDLREAAERTAAPKMLGNAA